MKVFLTKYALTKGIHIVDAEKTDSGYWRVEGHYQLYGINECFVIFDDAIAKAEEMKIKKLQSLDKQIKKISALNFDT